MPSVSVKAHFDGERIQLDEPIELARNAPLLVTVLPIAEEDSDRAGWTALGKQSLARAFGDDEPEYTIADIRR